MDLKELSKKELICLVSDAVRAIVTHYGLWFMEAEHQLVDLDRAIELEEEVWKNVISSLLTRVARRFGMKLVDGVPETLANMSKEELIKLLEDVAKSWLACDGFWFQAVERKYGMDTAKRINDGCWARFSYIEAKRIKKRLNLPERGGIAALRQALNLRQYARINRQETIDMGENKIVFRMNECRVQTARRQKGLPEYPCKSAGIVEYSRFAEGIDPRIKTRCVACPPDPHPEDWWCAWEFELDEEQEE
ncbi:MAG: hypothetical protein OD815_001035 [Candidatus Alkanophagales archaeon MCA70_species_2]|nr:hypothetical protein [Candidatus Alkanophaga liquidiphilum]